MCPESPLFPSRRRVLALLGALTLGGALFGCSQTEAPAGQATPATATTETAPPAVGTLKVGLLTPGKVNDKGWSQLANDSVAKIKADLGAETVPAIEDTTLATVAASARELAQQGCTLIFFHGSEFDEAAETVAKDFPKTTFVVIGGRKSGANLTPIQFSAGQGTYLAGMLAAGMSQSGKLACVGGTEIPIIKEAFASFEKGAKALKPTVEVKTVFTGDSKDIAKAKQQTQSLLDGGVDVVVHNANDAAPGVAQAVTEKKGALFIGANAPQDDLATPQNIGSFVIDVQAAYQLVAKAVKEGKSEGKPYAFGVKEKVVGLHYNDKFAGKIPDDLKAKITTAEADIAAGKIQP